ncbi:hypothetical protein BCU86_00430 [Vibrio lentus]|nr:hypothetical protein BCU86_00430 [Vibrio lentus]PMH91288.1 hypothetical protein BCU56_02010 [Vibrio lentus]PMJ00252.1 hypothetical protein BCU32_11860 [Vibrio lentus]
MEEVISISPSDSCWTSTIVVSMRSFITPKDEISTIDMTINATKTCLIFNFLFIFAASRHIIVEEIPSDNITPLVSVMNIPMSNAMYVIIDKLLLLNKDR